MDMVILLVFILMPVHLHQIGDLLFVSHLFYFEKLGSNSKRCKCTSDTITPFFVTKNLYQDDRLEMSIGHF